MSEVRITINQCCDVDVIRSGKDWLDYHDPQKRFSTLSRDCREWQVGETNAKILTLVEEHSRPGTVMVFTDWSMRRRVVLSPHRPSARYNGMVVTEGSGAFAQTNSSICMAKEHVP